MSTTNRNITYPWFKAINCWQSVDAHTKNGGGGLYCYLLCKSKLPIRLLGIITTQSLVNYSTYMTTKRWCSVDAHFNWLSIQYLLPSIIDFILIWLDLLLFCLIETQPCGKAKRRNDLALFILTRLKMMYHAKWFIAPAIHLFMNQYSRSTSYHSPIIYL